jgi:hypothetical protein
MNNSLLEFSPASLLRLWQLLSFQLILPMPALAADFSTTGVEGLKPFFAKTDTTGPVTVLSFGDSMADSYRSLNFVLMEPIY